MSIQSPREKMSPHTDRARSAAEKAGITAHPMVAVSFSPIQTLQQIRCRLPERLLNLSLGWLKQEQYPTRFLAGDVSRGRGLDALAGKHLPPVFSLSVRKRESVCVSMWLGESVRNRGGKRFALTKPG